MANSKIREHSLSCRDFARIRRARSRRPVSAPAGDRCPTGRSRRRPFGGGRIRARQAPAVDPQSVMKTVAESPSADRVVAGLCAVFMRPSRLIRSAIVFKSATLLGLHRALIQRKYRRLFSSKWPTKPGPKGPSQDVIAAVVDMKQRNPTWGVHGSHSRSRWPSMPSHACGSGRAPAGAESGHRRRESLGVSVATTLSWPVSHADGRVTPSIRSAFTAAI